MGYPMAGHLVAAGFDVTVFNRTTQKAKQWVEKYGAKLALSHLKQLKMLMLYSCVWVMTTTLDRLPMKPLLR